jgi:hypothetical protein
MMKRFLILTGLSIAACNSVAGAQVGPSGRGIPTVTRTVKMFSGLENELFDAIQKRDRAALDKLVADNFELRSAAAPGTPTAREEWLTQSLQLAPFESSIEQMAVHEYGELMVVSFLWKINAAKGAALPQSVFVVDTWKRSKGNWQAMARYAAPVAGAMPDVPGAVAPTAQATRKKI